MKILKILLILLLILPAVYASDAVIYKNEACGHCSMYLFNLNQFLQKNGITDIQEKNLINDESTRIELSNLNKERNIPPELQGHMVVVLNKNLILEGHVPIKVLEELFKTYNGNFPEIILYQDSMDEGVSSYKIMNDNKIKECSIDKPITECTELKDSFWRKSVLLLTIFSGLLAGIHPCTISVLLFFIAFLFTIRRTRQEIFKVGASYIIGIFLAYLLVGLGVFRVFTFSTPHFSAIVGAILVSILGFVNIISYFTEGRIKFSLGIPSSLKPKIMELIHKSTLPAAFIVGIIVGICSFGCTAGIYISIISLLLLKATYVLGFVYLILYNLMFILPLIIILFIASNKKIIQKLENIESKEKHYLKLIAGIIMILLALLILYITSGH